MTDIEKLNSLRREVSSSPSREKLDSCFKKWREKHLEPLRKKIKEASSAEEKKRIGLELQTLSREAQEIYQEKKASFSTWSQPFYEARQSVEKKTNFKVKYSSRNLLSELIQTVVKFLEENQFLIYEESEIVKVSENFDSLLIPEGHPARASSDSFFLSSFRKESAPMMLRTHTTTSTLKILEKYSKTPLRGSSLGSVYRKEDNNSTHLSQFTQLDLVWADKFLDFSNVKQLIESLLFSLLGEGKTQYRIRPSYFPFTSPSYEVDLECSCCLNPDCKLCKGTGWIEILGCGFLREEIVSKTHKGFIVIALGVGLERITMIKYSLSDMRSLYRNELKAKVYPKKID